MAHIRFLFIRTINYTWAYIRCWHKWKFHIYTMYETDDIYEEAHVGSRFFKVCEKCDLEWGCVPAKTPYYHTCPKKRFKH